MALSLSRHREQPRHTRKPALAHFDFLTAELTLMKLCPLPTTNYSLTLRISQRIRKILYKLTVENKELGLGQETIFDFKYVPQSSLLKTPLGDMGGDGKQIGRSERRSLVTLAVLSVVVGSVAWFGFRAALRGMGVHGVFA